MSRREHLLHISRGLTLRGEELHAATLRAIRIYGADSARVAILRAELAETRRARAEMLAAVERLDGETLDAETVS